jgi:plastocyanin
LSQSAQSALVVNGCGGGPHERTVLVDFSHDEFTSSLIAYFPNEVTIAAGDTLDFKQVWTGETHTVTGGTLINEFMHKVMDIIRLSNAFEGLRSRGVDIPEEGEKPTQLHADAMRAVEQSTVEPYRTRFLEAYDALVKQGFKIPRRDNPGKLTNAQADKIFNDAFNPLFESGPPYAYGDDGVAQNAGQRCFLTEGLPPKDPKTPCPDDKQRQPVFNGKHSYYNSGLIPYEGAQGNTYKVQFAPDTKPGSYFFYCSVHGPQQYTEVKVRPKGSKIPSQESVSRRARAQIAELAGPLLQTYRDAKDGSIDIDGATIRTPFAGLPSHVHGFVSEFIPKRITARVGEKVTWKLMGAQHTISFGVPNYFPIIQFAKDGTVSQSPKLNAPAGGSPKIPEGEGVQRVDGGTYGGEGFFSSGLLGSSPYAEYSLRFSKPGTYKVACLVHPPMVGTVVVTS